MLGRAFQYGPLPDSSKHIRLLKLSAGGSDDQEDIFCLIETHELERAPPYHAISYTWGEPCFDHVIRIDGAVLMVTENCWYALWQQSRISGDAHVWVDSVCINQKDVAEKSTQVALMGDIFSRAELVDVSLGTHRDDSEFLMQSLDLDFRPGGDRRQNWFSTLDNEKSLRIVESLRCITERPYFTRLWVIPEIALARKARILVGPDTMTFRDLQILELQIDLCLSERAVKVFTQRGKTCAHDHEALTARYPRFECADGLSAHFSRVMEHLRESAATSSKAFTRMPLPEKPTFDRVLWLFRDHRCLDPRDRIFALARIAHWATLPTQDGLPLKPDYSKSTTEVALDALDAYRLFPHDDEIKQNVADALQYATAIRDALGLSSSNAELMHMTGNYSKLNHEALYDDARLAHDDGHRFLWHCAKKDGVISLRAGQADSLMANLFFHEAHGKYADSFSQRRAQQSEELEELASVLRELHGEGSFVRVETNNTLAGIICGEAKAGDMIYMVGSGRPGWVLRQITASAFALIGLAFMNPFACRCSPSKEPSIYDPEEDPTICKCPFGAAGASHVAIKEDLRVVFDTEDLLLLATLAREDVVGTGWGFATSITRNAFSSYATPMSAPFRRKVYYSGWSHYFPRFRRRCDLPWERDVLKKRLHTDDVDSFLKYAHMDGHFDD